MNLSAKAETIEEIADHANLLALTSALEAVRALEQGRNPAEVDREVRALAERSVRATEGLGEMIREMRSESRSLPQ